MTVQETVSPTIDRKTLAEKVYIHKMIKAGLHYLESKLVGYPVDAQLSVYKDCWRAVITVQWVPQEIPPRVESEGKPEGSA
jgi:hypothetical protein